MTERDRSSDQEQPEDSLPADQSLQNSAELRRQRRHMALKAAAGLWKNRADIPADGLEYERELRKEWDRDE